MTSHEIRAQIRALIEKEMEREAVYYNTGDVHGLAYSSGMIAGLNEALDLHEDKGA